MFWFISKNVKCKLSSSWEMLVKVGNSKLIMQTIFVINMWGCGDVYLLVHHRHAVWHFIAFLNSFMEMSSTKKK